MNNDKFILSFSEGIVADEHMDLINLDIPNKTNNEVSGNFKRAFGSKIIEELIVLISEIYSLACQGQSLFSCCICKEKGIKKKNGVTHTYRLLQCIRERCRKSSN